MTISKKPQPFAAATTIATALLILSAAPAAHAQEAAAIAEKTAQAIDQSQRSYLLGQFEDAAAAAKKAIGMQPENAVAYNNLAVSYAGLGNWDQAIKAIRTAIRLQPGFPLAVNNLAWFLRAKPSALSVAEVARDAASWLDLSLGYYQNQRYADSIDAAREVLKLQPETAAAHSNIAAAYASMAMWDDAIQAAQAALLLNPDFQLARNNLAWAESGKLNGGAAVKQ